MEYIDRKGNLTVEETGQDKFLRHLYQDWGGRLCLKVLVRPFVTRLGGWFLNSRLSVRMIRPFIEKNHIDMSQYEKTQYASYNDFFTRKVLPEARPLDMRREVLVSPCDGKLSVHKISQGSRFSIKNMGYTVASLLRDEKLAARYEGGWALIFRLTVDDYHRYCYPAEGVKSANVRIQGVYHTVNPVANDALPIYRENTREYTILQTEQFGTLLLMEVGAMMVGKINNYSRSPRKVEKGQEKGRFEFGGSTIVVLVQKNRLQPDWDLPENTENGYETIVKMGERIGKCKLPKRAGKSH